MTKRKLKPFVLPTIYALSVIMLVLSMYLIQSIISNSMFDANEMKNEIEYVDGEITDDKDQELPVVSTKTKINKPYVAEDVTIAKSYYDYKADAKDQQNAIVYYENTYMQNSGVDYKSDNVFDVLSIMDGDVISVKEDSILGNVVEIRHNTELVSVYQSLSEVNVKEGDKVISGQAIGKSGTSNINSDMGNHLHFELYYQGLVVNPEENYDKNLEDLD